MYRTTFAGGRRLPLAAVVCILVAVAFLSAFAALQQVPINFETKPGPIAAGSDPSIAVRDTGDIYLLRVQNGNLCTNDQTTEETDSVMPYVLTTPKARLCLTPGPHCGSI